jgi:hypothetical protein
MEESTVDIEDITETYTGQRVGFADLVTAAHVADPLARAMARVVASAVERAAYAVGDIDADLARVAASIGDTADRVQHVLAATAGQPVRSLNPLGELQANGPRFDVLIAARDGRIAHLRTVTSLWWHLHAPLPPPADLARALAGAGFEPITTAHASTRAAFGHHGGDRTVTVSLDPFGEPGVEISTSDADTVGWTITAGPEVPVTVLTAIAFAAIGAPHPHTGHATMPTGRAVTDPDPNNATA